MIQVDKLDIERLQQLVLYLLKNRNNIQNIIAEFGKPVADNGVGTIFLHPLTPLFKVFWIHESSSNKIESVGVGGTNLGLFLKDLFNYYKHYNEGFERYDDEYVYVFYTSKKATHSIKIRSREKLFKEKTIVDNIPINSIEIVLM